jgi:hypothetical protein
MMRHTLFQGLDFAERVYVVLLYAQRREEII